jgi:hypothetical protein
LFLLLLLPFLLCFYFLSSFSKFFLIYCVLLCGSLMQGTLWEGGVRGTGFVAGGILPSLGIEPYINHQMVWHFEGNFLNVVR